MPRMDISKNRKPSPLYPIINFHPKSSCKSIVSKESLNKGNKVKIAPGNTSIHTPRHEHMRKPPHPQRPIQEGEPSYKQETKNFPRPRSFTLIPTILPLQKIPNGATIVSKKSRGGGGGTKRMLSTANFAGIAGTLSHAIKIYSARKLAAVFLLQRLQKHSWTKRSLVKVRASRWGKVASFSPSPWGERAWAKGERHMPLAMFLGTCFALLYSLKCPES